VFLVWPLPHRDNSVLFCPFLNNKVVSLCEKPRDPPLKYIVADTPGQIEIFTWSASGAIITEVCVARQIASSAGRLQDGSSHLRWQASKPASKKHGALPLGTLLACGVLACC
jgi:hypothetical protein